MQIIGNHVGTNIEIKWESFSLRKKIEQAEQAIKDAICRGNLSPTEQKLTEDKAINAAQQNAAMDGSTSSLGSEC